MRPTNTREFQQTGLFPTKKNKKKTKTKTKTEMIRLKKRAPGFSWSKKNSCLWRRCVPQPWVAFVEFPRCAMLIRSQIFLLFELVWSFWGKHSNEHDGNYVLVLNNKNKTKTNLGNGFCFGTWMASDKNLLFVLSIRIWICGMGSCVVRFLSWSSLRLRQVWFQWTCGHSQPCFVGWNLELPVVPGSGWTQVRVCCGKNLRGWRQEVVLEHSQLRGPWVTLQTCVWGLKWTTENQDSNL